MESIHIKVHSITLLSEVKARMHLTSSLHMFLIISTYSPHYVIHFHPPQNQTADVSKPQMDTYFSLYDSYEEEQVLQCSSNDAKLPTSLQKGI